MTGIVTAYLAASIGGLWLEPPSLVASLLLVLWWQRRGISWPVHVAAVAAAALGAWIAISQVNTELDRRQETPGSWQGVVTVEGIASHASGRTRFRGRTEDGRQFALSMEGQAVIASGVRLDVEVQLRPVRGLANPGGFDYALYALHERLHAGGYIKRAQVVGRDPGILHALHRERQRISTWLHSHASGSASRVLPALAVGDRQYLRDDDTRLLAATGTAHLLAISGLHIALVAALAMLLSRFLARLGSPVLLARMPIAVLPLGYAALAGFSLSTRRALVMLAVWGLLRLLHRPPRAVTALALAGAAVVALDPLAPLGAAFWLSFGAVAILIASSSGNLIREGRILGLVRTQATVVCAMAPLLVTLGLRVGAASIPANLVAIPFVASAVVPITLIVVALGWAHEQLATALLGLPEWTVDLLWIWLEGLEALFPSAAPAPGLMGIALSCFLAPRGLGLRGPAVLLGLASLLAISDRPQQGDFRVQVIDVGQGLSVLVETASHTLLYDAGPLSRGGWDAGARVVAPYLLSRNHGRLDRIVISHGDSDHAGGLKGLLDAGISTTSLLTTDPDSTTVGAKACRAGEAWTWDAVRFTVMHPGTGLPYLGNDSSCVLHVASAAGSVLLPGDVSTTVERRLARKLGRTDVLIAAHHGSRGSTGAAILAAIDPTLVVFASGYGNRFGMPHPDVLARTAGRYVVDTGHCGAITIEVSKAGLYWRNERARRQRAWHPQDGVGKNQYDCAL